MTDRTIAEDRKSGEFGQCGQRSMYMVHGTIKACRVNRAVQ